jgi:hypothetical protein
MALSDALERGVVKRENEAQMNAEGGGGGDYTLLKND